MNSKQKAEELVSDFYSINCKLIEVKNGYDMGNRYNLVFPKSKQCALIAVNELIKIACDYSDYDETVTKEYWEKVKIEIENL